MARSSVTATPQGIQLLLETLSHWELPQIKLARKLGIARSTLSNLIAGKPVDRELFVKVCESLDLDWKVIADLPEARQAKFDWQDPPAKRLIESWCHRSNNPVVFDQLWQTVTQTSTLAPLLHDRFTTELLCRFVEDGNAVSASLWEIYDNGFKCLLRLTPSEIKSEAAFYFNLPLRRKQTLMCSIVDLFMQAECAELEQAAVIDCLERQMYHLLPKLTAREEIRSHAHLVFRSMITQGFWTIHGSRVSPTHCSVLIYFKTLTLAELKSHAEIQASLDIILSRFSDPFWRTVFELAVQHNAADEWIKALLVRLQSVQQQPFVAALLTWATQKAEQMQSANGEIHSQRRYSLTALSAFYLSLIPQTDLPLELPKQLDPQWQLNNSWRLDLLLSGAFYGIEHHPWRTQMLPLILPDLDPLQELEFVLQIAQAFDLKGEFSSGFTKLHRSQASEENWSQRVRETLQTDRNLMPMPDWNDSERADWKRYCQLGLVLLDIFRSEAYITRSLRESVTQTLFLAPGAADALR